MPTPISLVVTETEDSTVTVTIDAILAALQNETLTIGPSGGFIVQQGADISFPGYHATHNYDMFIDDIVPNTDNSVTFGRGGSHEDGARYLREVYTRGLFADLINTEANILNIGGSDKQVRVTGVVDFLGGVDFRGGFDVTGQTSGISYDDLEDKPTAIDLTSVNNTLDGLRAELGTRPVSNNVVWEQIEGLHTTIQGQQTNIESLDTAENLNTSFRTAHTAVDHSQYLTALPADPVFNTITASRYLGPTNPGGTERHMLVGQSDHPTHIYHISNAATTQRVTYHWAHTLHEDAPWGTSEVDLSAVAEDYLPDMTNMRDIGSPTHQIAQIYANLGRFASTIHAPGINSGTETVSANGTWTFPGTVNFTGTVTGVETGDTYGDGSFVVQSVVGSTGIVLEELGDIRVNRSGFTSVGQDGSPTSDVEGYFLIPGTGYRDLIYTNTRYTNWAEVGAALLAGEWDGLVVRVWQGSIFYGPSGWSHVAGSDENILTSQITPIAYSDLGDEYNVGFAILQPQGAGDQPGISSSLDSHDIPIVVRVRTGGVSVSGHEQSYAFQLVTPDADVTTDTQYNSRITRVAVYGVKFPAINTAEMPSLYPVGDADSGTLLRPWNSIRTATLFTDEIRPHSGTIEVGHTADNLTMNFHDPEFTVQDHETGTWGANNRALASVHARDIRAQTIRNYQGTELVLGFNTHTVRVPNGATLDLEAGASLDVTGATLTGFPSGGLGIEEIWYLAQDSDSDPDVTANTLVAMNTTGTWNTGWSAQVLWQLGEDCKGLVFQVASTRNMSQEEYASSDTVYVPGFGNVVSARDHYYTNGRIYIREGVGIGGITGLYYQFDFQPTAATFQLSGSLVASNTTARHIRLFVIR